MTLACEKRWTLTLDDAHERHLRTIVDIGALARERCKLGALLAIHPDHPDVTFDERTVLEVALLLGLRVLAEDLEHELGVSLTGTGVDGDEEPEARPTGECAGPAPTHSR
jgi:hypothetical protein